LAKDLAVRSVADGIDFQQGTLTARLDGQQLHVDDFTLFGAGGAAGGQVKVTGVAQWLPAGKTDDTLAQRVQLTLQASAKALRLSTRSDRRITISGNLSAQLKDTLLTLRGKLSADQALLTLPSESTPTLGDDVVVRPSATQAAQEALTQPKASAKATAADPAKRPTKPITTDVQVTLDLGPSFQVRGRGLETRLAGNLELRAAGSAAPTLTGTVRTVRGTYQAYGQRLEIEQGLLRFFGPADNPALDILAIRPKMTQRVGVQVLGTALSPIVRLYAEPELPEAEKLSWLVLGRSASGSGGEAALLQQAALALLGGSGQGPSASLTQALGLDELSFRGSSGETTSGATVTLGKRLSNDFYVAYESGLAGSMGVFTIFYDLSRRLTLRAQTGEQSAVDLIWTYRYD
jgi:translocation and assembly module TamB